MNPENPQGEGQTPPQPAPKFALEAQQQEINRLRADNGRLHDNNVYLSALYNESQEVIGSLLEQLSRETPAPDETPAENPTES